MPELIDEAARNAVRERLGETLFVDAGAGTGKTSELVCRIVNLVHAGVAIRQIAAITFTDAAASELRHRVRRELESAVPRSAKRSYGARSDVLDGEDDEDVDGRLAAALADIDDAAFTTLHAFAQRILSDHPLDARLPPRIEVLDEITAVVRFEHRWDRFLAELLDSGDAALVRRGVVLGLKTSALHDLAAYLDGNADRTAAIGAPPPLPPVKVGALRTTLADALALAGGCVDHGDKLYRHLRDTVQPIVDDLAAGGGDDELLGLLEARPKLAFGHGKSKAWAAGCFGEVKQRLGQAQEQRDEILAEQRDAVARGLAARIAAFTDAGFEQRRRDGLLQFQDLLILARDLLARNPGVRRRVRRRYTHLLIDEFQDTDPLQVEIAVLLGCDAPIGHWWEAPLDPGSLFFVGDPKQSIYRFRRADIAVYERAKNRLPVTPAFLRQSFRCVPDILTWVNATFTALIGAGDSEQQAPYVPLAPFREPVGEQPAVRCFGDATPRPVSEVRVAEAADVARVVERVLAERWTVCDRDSGEQRPVKPSDIAVLVRRHATVRLLERTLEERAIAYRIESKSLVFASDEVRDLLTMLRAVEDPADEVAVVAALRHPAFDCSDLDLLTWRAAGHGWDYRAAARLDGGADDPVARGLSRLAALRGERWSYTLGGLVEHLIDSLRLLELGFAHRRPRDRWRRLRFLAEQAHAFHDAGGHLRGFLRWAAQQTEQDVRVDEYLVPESDDEAVRITTVHGAKGLEYPVVVLLGLDTDLSRLANHPRMLATDDGGAEFSVGGTLRSRGYDAAKDHEKAMGRHESDRLLYVGATRARDHLLVSLHHKENVDCHAAQLRALGPLAGLWAPLDLDAALPPPTPAAPRDDGHIDATPEQRHAWAAERSALLAAASRPRVHAATGLAAALAQRGGRENGVDDDGRLAAGDDGSTDDGQLGARDAPGRKGRAGTSVGRAVHGVLQTVDLADACDVEDVAAAQAAVEGVPSAAARIATLARTALGSGAVAAAVASGRYWRELYVGAPVEGETVEGFIDLLYADGDDLVVVDYKTDSLSGRSAADAVQRYRPQAAAYALALETTTGQRVARCVFVLTASPRAVEVTISGADLDAAKAEVRRLLRENAAL